MKMTTVIRDVFVLVGFVLASTTGNAQESAFFETSQFEQLQSHESAAAVEAAKIRELKASGIESDSDRLKELEQNLNSHLDAAFDLKLQLEERQVKTLQTRLSQLESQIGQRKQLRDKIIARRAAELVDGAALEWSSQNNQTELKSAENDSKDSIPVVGPEGTEPNAVSCPSTKLPPPVDVLRELERRRGIEPGAISNDYKLHKDSIRIVVEPVYDHIDPAMTFPLIGRASLHRLRWRVTVTSHKTQVVATNPRE